MVFLNNSIVSRHTGDYFIIFWFKYITSRIYLSVYYLSHSFNKFLLSIHYVLGTILSTEDRTVNISPSLISLCDGMHFWSYGRATYFSVPHFNRSGEEIQPVHPKENQFWIFIGRTDAEAKTPILWPPHVKSWLIGKKPDAGKEGRQEEKGTAEDEMAGWHHRLNGHEFE